MLAWMRVGDRGVDGTELGFACIGVSDSGCSRFVRMSKLLLEDGKVEDGAAFLGVEGGFLLCLFLLVTLVKPSGSNLFSISVVLGVMFKGQPRKR